MARRTFRRRPVVHLYCLCWNEERMLPFFFRHYDRLVDRYFVFDNGSTDRSPDLLTAHPKVTLGRFEVAGGSLIGEARRFYDTVWHGSRGVADWVFIVNIDEHLHHPDGQGYFQRCIDQGVTAIRATGYEMIAERFPAETALLSDSVTAGVRAEHMDKLAAFQPDAITRLGFGAGRHEANPQGRVVVPAEAELMLLHYKFLGGDYVVQRYAELGARIGDADRARGWAKHYFQKPEKLLAVHRDLLARAQPLSSLRTTPRA